MDGRTMPMTGALVVSNGTFEVNGANEFPYVTSVTVHDGARFDWKATVADAGLRGVTALRLGANAVFEIHDGATLPFTRKSVRAVLRLDLADTARLLLPANTDLAVRGMNTNGVALAPGTVCSGVAGEGVVVLPQLAGRAVRLRVLTAGDGLEDIPLSARAYVQDGLVCQLDGIENAGYGVTDTAATVWKDLTGQTGDFTLYPGVGAFTGTALQKIASGCLARNDFRRTNVRTIETSVSDVSRGTSYAMPVFAGQNQNIVLTEKDGDRLIGFDNRNFGWKTAVKPSRTTFTAFYSPGTCATGFLQDAVLPGGELYSDEYWSDNNSPSGGTTLGGRSISWSGYDTSPFGYSIQSVRFYDRELTGAEITNNWLVDCIRFRDTIPTSTPDYRPSAEDPNALECRLSFTASGAAVSVDGAVPLVAVDRWFDLGVRVTLTAVPEAGLRFVGWVGMTDAIVSGSPTDAQITVLVNRALTLSAHTEGTPLIVSCDTNLTASVLCQGVLFLGPYTLSANEGCTVTILEDGDGIQAADGVTGTCTIACPLAVGALDGGAEQTFRAPDGVTLVLAGDLSGKTALRLPGPGAYSVSGGPAYLGDMTLAVGTLTVKGAFMSADSELTVAGESKLFLDGCEIGGTVVESATGVNHPWLNVKSATENRLRGGFVSMTQQKQMNFETGGVLWIERKFSDNAGSYVTPTGEGALHLTNLTSVGTMCGAYLPSAGVTTHLWAGQPFRVGNHLSANGALVSHAANMLAHSPLHLINTSSWDLGGFDQTCGRFSWMETFSSCEIRSEKPATLLVYQDRQSGSGSNRGPMLYRAKISGAVSLVKTGNETSESAATDVRLAEDLVIGSAMTSTGAVSSVWGLLSFTNGADCVGSWLGCPVATAGGTVDGRGEAQTGVLELLHSKVFSRNTDVRIRDGGKVRLGPGVAQRVRDLYLDGSEEKAVHGSWGSCASTAKYKDDAHFDGPGVLLVLGKTPGTVFIFR